MPQKPIPHKAPHPQANMETPTASHTPINTERASDTATHPGPSNASVLSAHRRLFGEGARVEGASRADGVEVQRRWNDATADEMAFSARPRSADYGKDINLPAPKKGGK